MKLFYFLLTAWLLTTAYSVAQDVLFDPALQSAVHAAVPAEYLSIANSVLLIAMILGRGLTALANGRGIKGWLSAIINGTNGPHVWLALLALLSILAMPSCTVGVDWKLLSKQTGQAAIDAAAPIVVKAITTPDAKQPQSVQP